jgi:hypothetical protein
LNFVGVLLNFIRCSWSGFNLPHCRTEMAKYPSSDMSTVNNLAVEQGLQPAATYNPD